jgi:trehalose 6-phosphate synthase
VLLLSEFAGAAEEMGDATLMNPYDPERCAVQVRDALTLPPDERRRAMERLRGSLRSIYDWMGDVFTRWGEVTEAEAPGRAFDPAREDEEMFGDDPEPAWRGGVPAVD